MGESPWLLLFLALMSVSLAIMTATLVVTSRDVRRTLARLNELFPHCDDTLLEAHRTLEEFRHLLTSTNRSASHLEAATHRVAQMVLRIIDQCMAWKAHAVTLFGSRMSNGAGAEPRHQKRSSWKKRRGME